MHHWKLRTLALVAALTFAGSPAFAQGIPGMPSMMPGGGMQQERPRRKLHKNASPVLSPALNLLPQTQTTFEGQFLMRQLPQEQFNRSVTQNNKTFENLQNKLGQQDAQIKAQETQIRSGLGKTGHASRFMNYGSYYSMGGSNRKR